MSRRLYLNPKYPSTNKTITTAPTSQMMLFMMRSLNAAPA
ncbi:hypothetical protein LMG19083_02173 [Ralstonia psammae]|uniref:Uncharacterized protein n=1 Tax=Ralstonia psammae TaxID=3058598 RepID=A0ABN9ITF3_9RALS|nr:hypothetical protein LMG19083_02173 [Ralstonia sp. LMG 19083]